MASHVLEPKTATALVVKEGQRIRISDVDGEQVADFVCFSEHDHGERFSQAKNPCTQLERADKHRKMNSSPIATM